MIWKFDFQPRSLIWLLAIALVVGLGLRGAEIIQARKLVYPLTVTRATSESSPLAHMADSIMAMRRERENGPININTAAATELESLPGIGPVLAGGIVKYRQEHGPFEKVDDLAEVSGIGPKRLAAIRSRCVIDSALDHSVVR